MSKFSDLKKNKKKIDYFIDGVEEYQNQASSKEKEKTERLNVEIPKSLHKAIKIQAAQHEIKIKDVVIKAINDHLKK